MSRARGHQCGAPREHRTPSTPVAAAKGVWVAYGSVCITVMGLVVAVWDASSGRAEPPKEPGRAAAPVVIEIKNFQFTPETVTIARERTVRWINADVANHQISSGVVEAERPRPDGRLSSPLLIRGDEFSTTFRTPGDYSYYCGVHPFMRGTVVVK